MVPKVGFEPTQAYAYGALNTACLPIPPLRHVKDSLAEEFTVYNRLFSSSTIVIVEKESANSCLHFVRQYLRI